MLSIYLTNILPLCRNQQHGLFRDDKKRRNSAYGYAEKKGIKMKRKHSGIEPKGKGWKVVGYFPEWTVWRRTPVEGICLVRIIARGERGGVANLTIGWDFSLGKAVGVSRGTGICLKKMRKDYSELLKDVETLMLAETVEEEEKSGYLPEKVKDYSPKSEGWKLVEEFVYQNWKLWIKDSHNGWYTLKIVSAVPASKMCYWANWCETEKRFAKSVNMEKLTRNIELYEKLSRFFKNWFCP